MRRAHIFAPNLHSMGLMKVVERYENYKSLFELINTFIPPPEFTNIPSFIRIKFS